MKMKPKLLILIALMVLIAAGVAFAAGPEEKTVTPEDLFKKDFPNVKVQSFGPSPIPGVYEVVVDDRVVYYSPSAYSVILGQIITNEGKNLTRDREMALLTAKLKDLPLDKAVKIGNGKNVVIEFTDPDCPFCRQAEQFLSERTDITKYVFLIPLPSHTDSIPKIRYILCAQDQKKALEDAMSGKLDDMKFQPCADPKVDELVKTHEAVAQKMVITATPTFFINGTPVRGADVDAMKKLLDMGPQAK